MPQESNEATTKGYNFGTLSGVFTPSILTIFGLIMFMRTSQVVGEAGVRNALLILLAAQAITLSTALSMSAISTNTPVSGGGVYFLISRTLGSSFGGAIGVTLFLAQALSIPFYILGFSESLISTFEVIKPDHVLWVNLITAVLLFLLSWVGAKYAIKAQFFILAVLGLAITAFIGGAAMQFSTETLQTNMTPKPGGQGAFAMFALFFPAVTGIMAGVNMSGDLKDPQKSIPRGSLIAVAVATVVYGAQMILTGGAFGREALISEPFTVLVSNAIFGAGYLVVAGVFAATTSSAIGSFLGAPRVLQALGVDKVYKLITPFRKGSGEANEPRRALLLAMVITLGIIMWAGRPESGNGVNRVAEIVSMFFLYTYGMVNLAAFVESFGANPSFRPRFRFYHWGVALFGAVSCLGVSLMINAVASVIAFFIMLGLYYRARSKAMKQTFGDAQRGFVYSRIRNNLLKLADMPVHPKNWRPTICVLTGNPSARLSLLNFATRFEGQCGIVSMVEFMVGDFDKLHEMWKSERKRLAEFVASNDLQVFPEVIVTPDFDFGLREFLQAHSIGPIKPNIVMLGWPKGEERVEPFVKHLKTILKLEKSCLIAVDHPAHPRFEKPDGHFVDVWWRGKTNGSLMLLLAYLLQGNPGWKRSKIRILRTVSSEDGVAPATKALEKLVEKARMEAETKVIVCDDFGRILHEESRDSAAVFLGFIPPDEEWQQQWYDSNHRKLEALPPTFMVCSSGDADLLA